MPLQLSGEIQRADKEKLSKMLPNDFTFSFASFRTKPSVLFDSGMVMLPGSSTNTINFQGASYTLISLRVTTPQHLNFSDNQGSLFLELIATFQNTRPSKEAPFLFMLCFPIYNNPNGSKNAFLNATFNPAPMTGSASLLDMVSEAQDFMFYTSCIPMIAAATTEIKSISCCVLVATRALPLYKSGDWQHRFYLLPSMYLMDYNTIVDFKLENFQFVQSSIKRGPYGRTYSATVLTSGDQFTKRFSLYTYDKALLDQATAKQCQSRQLSTSQLKCFPIKAKQDIKSGILLVDPKTGKRMDVFLQEQDAANYPKPSQDTTGDKLATILGITIGVLAAVVIAGFVAVYFYQFNKKPPAGAFKAHVKVAPGAASGSSFKAHVKVNGTADAAKPEAPAKPETIDEDAQTKENEPTELTNANIKVQEMPKPEVVTHSQITPPSRLVSPSPQKEVKSSEITQANPSIPAPSKATIASAAKSAAKSPEQIQPTSTVEPQKIDLVNTTTIPGPSKPNNVTPSAKPALRRTSFDQPAGLAKPTTKENLTI